MVKATAKNCANTLLSTRVANHFHRVANDAVHHLHCAIALEVTSNSSMVEHLSHKQNEPVRIRRRPRWGSQKTSFHSRSANLICVEANEWTIRNSSRSRAKC